MTFEFQGGCNLSEDDKSTIENTISAMLAAVADTGTKINQINISTDRAECVVIIFESGNVIVICKP